MTTAQRIMSNMTLAFVSRIIAKASDAILFIMIARLIGVDEAGIFRLGKSYMAVALALSAWGLHDLLVRELAPRPNEGRRYLANYLAIRLVLAVGAYGILLLLLSTNLPYSEESKIIIRIFSLAIFPEALFAICEAFFVAYDRLLPPTIAGTVGGFIKLGGGLWLLNQTNDIVLVAWIIPIGGVVGLLPFFPALIQLFKEYPQSVSLQLDAKFVMNQIHHISGFIMIGIFYNLNDQQDTFLISLFLSETDLGWYGAAQTILFGVSMLSAAARTAIYPTMARYHQLPDRLTFFYKKINQYIILAVLPVATLISLLAEPIIVLIFTDAFAPAAVALRWMIWEIFFLFLHIPNARLMLVEGKQRQLGLITGIGLLINVSLNLFLVPRFGIVGAAISRPIIAFINFMMAYLFVYKKGLQFNILPLFSRPLVATAVLTTVVWILRPEFFIWPLLAGFTVYLVVIVVSGGITREDLKYFQQIMKKK